MQPKAPIDFLIVQLDKAFQDTIITDSGLTLFKGKSDTPEWDVTILGTVVSTPNRLSSKQELKGIEVEVVPGDKVLFSYLVVFDLDFKDRDNPVHHNLFYFEGQWYWKVDYQHVYGYIRNEKLHAVQDYVICEPVEEVTEKVGLIWMPEMSKKKKPEGKGKVVAIGKARKGEPELSINEGDVVRFPQKFACKYEIEGKQYLVLTQGKILATEI